MVRPLNLVFYWQVLDNFDDPVKPDDVEDTDFEL